MFDIENMPDVKRRGRRGRREERSIFSAAFAATAFFRGRMAYCSSLSCYYSDALEME
jgi:hypothetical protein